MTKIAIVEDSRSTAQSLEAVINLSRDYQCVCACASAEEALRELPQHQPEIVLMDIHLPGMSGVKCVPLLKNLLPQVRVIMITVYRNPDLIFGALRAGACRGLRHLHLRGRVPSSRSLAHAARRFRSRGARSADCGRAHSGISGRPRAEIPPLVSYASAGAVRIRRRHPCSRNAMHRAETGPEEFRA